ncbi:hypothetical protein MTF65_13430 [Streptomyces sp. APSN-46.1]|uniref:lantibiotic dehydratase C-terminal domain-containing protein n=1 Tax=Streptomyces sp. APSN-46.1 TaxID=2929049 RepID=UPI001FB475FD|nr:lantibiotic dehydratase C-terminal domain-containing protein [Streptomyces sp. APSN-46.1]MCJ1678331.1 hypothetical protein [Streptomyces sp. APSN-46.1]
MSRDWLFVRIPNPLRNNQNEDHSSRVLSTAVADLAGHLRLADPEGNWQFRRPDRSAGSNLGLWFHSTHEVLEELERRLRAHTAAHNWPVITDRYDPPTAKYRTSQTIRLADRLATESSEFALRLLQDGGPRPEERLPLATLHLWHLCALMAPADRAAFLFHFWQFGTDDLGPAGRVQLAAEADGYAATLLSSPPEVDGQVWERYVPAVRSVIGGRQDTGVPVNYLLYDHAQLTHDRLGIPTATAALGARALRGVLAAGATLPAFTAEARTLVLQSV